MKNIKQFREEKMMKSDECSMIRQSQSCWSKLRSSRVTFMLDRIKPAEDQTANSVRNTVAFSKNSIYSGSQQSDDLPNFESISKDSVVYGKSNHIDVFGVRVTPSVVTFTNAFENQSYMEQVSVQNISKNSVNIRIHNPRAWSFRLTPLERGFLLAPGLKITRRIHYTSTKAGIIHSSVPIYVNEKCFELPLEACKGQAFVDIIPTALNFGRVDIGTKPVEKKLVVRNVSSCATKFLLDLGRNELDLQVSPLKGWIRPHSSITIRLRMIALEVGELSSEIWITTDLSQSRVHVTVEACKRSLMALHPNSISDFTLIEFPITFYGCRHHQTVVVYNMAASSSAFVVLADFGNQNHQPLREARKDGSRHVRMFDVEPVEGRIRPFEGRIFTIWFQPTAPKDPERGWKSESNEIVHDFLCALRIKRIQVDDFGAQSITKSEEEMYAMNHPTTTKRTNSMQKLDTLMMDEAASPLDLAECQVVDDISVLLCIYGEAELATVTVVPNCLYFQQTPLGNREHKVIHVTNDSSHPLAFRYNKIPFFEVSPNFKKIDSKSTCDVAVTFFARNLGKLQKQLQFEVLAETDNNNSVDLQVVNYLNIKIAGEVVSHPTVPQPKFNLGITPMIAHEVGFLTDDVTFTSKVEKPKCAMVAVNRRGRPWIQSEATIAFPNDRPLTLRPRETDHTAKTIFKGIQRYIAPVDESLTYTHEELLQKKAHDNWFLHYIRGTAAVAVLKDRCCKSVAPDPEPHLPLMPDDSSPVLPRDVLVPLTFVQLYRITVSPFLISFGSVTTSKKCTQMLTMENKNEFDISAKILPITSGVHIQTLKSFIVNKSSETKVMLTFHRETLGKYSGIITCVINGYHSFDITVVAEVVPKSLAVSPDRVDYKFLQVPFDLSFIPLAVTNPLNTPVNFSWSIPTGSPITVEPGVGMVPKKGKVWCAAYFESDYLNYKLHPLRLVVENSLCLKLKSGVTHPKPTVYFLEPTLNIGYIPLQLPTVKQSIFFNPDFFDNMFVVLNKEPMKGVVVTPSSGIIKARSCYSLALHISMLAEGPFEFVVFLNVQNNLTLELKVIGVLVFPQVEVTPKYINLIRVPCSSVTRTTLIAENKSKAVTDITFNMDDFPQFKVSMSKRHHDPGISQKGFSLEPGSSRKFFLHFIPKDLASYDFYLPIVINNVVGNRSFSRRESDLHSKKVKSTYRKSTLKQEVSRRALNVPLPKTTMSHVVLIDVVVVKPQLAFSDMELIFTSTSESKFFTTTNTSEEEVSILFRPEDSLSFCFEIDKRSFKPTGQSVKERGSFKQTLLPGESINITATFIATAAGSYTADIMVMLCAQDHSMLYNSVRLTASISSSTTIYSSIYEIYFEPVPLGIDIKTSFHLIVSTSMEAVISYDIIYPHANLFSIEFPKGNSLPENSKRNVPVKLTFSSFSPVSLRKVITFQMRSLEKNTYMECSVIVLAVADNCILTTHAFLKAHSPHHQMLKHNDDSFERTVSDLLLATDQQILQPEQQLFGPKKSLSLEKSNSDKVGSSGSSNTSYTISLTTCSRSSNAEGKTMNSHSTRGSIFRSSYLTVNNNNSISTSDIDFPLQLDGEEESPLFDCKSTTLCKTVTKEAGESVFPMFPRNVADTEYAVHMNRTRNAVEQWVYEQVFNCSYYPILGSHMFSTFAHTKKAYGRSTPVAVRNVFDVLERICGRNVRRYFTNLDKMPEDALGKALFTYNLYKQLVDFMVAQGALISHVEPKYLMVYEEYCLYRNVVPCNSRSLDTSVVSESTEDRSSDLPCIENFTSISIQCWLDLFLQIFRTFILGPTVGMKVGSLDQEVAKRSIGTDVYRKLLAQDQEVLKKPSEVSLKRTMYSRAEDILLTWLTNLYNTHRKVVWPAKPPASRTVNSFDVDLEDGLVLATVTAAYCPFLTPIYFQDMFLEPVSVSQAYHNTICLTSAWDRIKLGYSVTPRDFVRPNTVKMLMLVTHLYKILPSYKPAATVKFQATLNSSEIQFVKLENVEESAITYSIEILLNTTCFTLEDCKDSFVLKRKEKGQITVRYTARNTVKVNAILLLCGACMPPKFGRNYVFSLEGNPVKLPVSSIFNLISPLNIASTTHVTIETPHVLDKFGEQLVDYDIWIADTEPQPGNVNALCWMKERKRKIPRRLFILSDRLTVKHENRQTSGKLLLQVCCFSMTVNHYWLIFMNPEIGDFIVKLEITPSLPEPSSTLTAIVDPKGSSCSCQSQKAFVCSHATLVHIPCRNLDQWTAVQTMFELTISSAEQEFWATYIESNIGFRLLQWMLEEKKEKLNKEIELIFKKSKTYKVSCQSPHVFCTPTIHIPNVRSRTSVGIPIHLDSESPNHSTVLTLTSSDGQENRCYSLNIVLK